MRAAAYKEGGPAAEARFDAGVAGYEARAFRGCGIFTSGAPSPFDPSAQRTPDRATDTPLPAHPPAHRAVRGLRRLGLCADAHALVADRRVLHHEPAPSQAGQRPAHVRHAHLRRGERPPRAHHVGGRPRRVLHRGRREARRLLRAGAHVPDSAKLAHPTDDMVANSETDLEAWYASAPRRGPTRPRTRERSRAGTASTRTSVSWWRAPSSST